MLMLFNIFNEFFEADNSTGNDDALRMKLSGFAQDQLKNPRAHALGSPGCIWGRCLFGGSIEPIDDFKTR